ncbi:MAG TPA: FKBP-type peptidyl-prolyl cis-trans isomerase [bacterium]|jgi:FKBP-type peptidyl-prolyl cis-trans isomerase FkpA|nr:FKBP-type peptidyl-prolyl cis-trans isomerase [bacterium]
MRLTARLTALAAGAALAAGCASAPQSPAGGDQSQAQAAPAAAPTAAPTVNPDLGSLKITDEVLGTGAEAVAGKKLTVNYTGRLLTGAEFDSTAGRGPFSFTLGAGEVIKGWDEGMTGMRVGGTRQLVIPSYLAYGDTGQGPIPPNATLVFEVELLDVE